MDVIGKQRFDQKLFSMKSSILWIRFGSFDQNWKRERERERPKETTDKDRLRERKEREREKDATTISDEIWWSRIWDEQNNIFIEP